MRQITERIHDYTDEELRELLSQMDRLNKKGYTEEQPLRDILNSAGANALVTASIIIYKEAAERWLNQ